MVGMSQDGNVAVAGAPLRTQGVEGVLGMSTVAADGGGDLLVDDDVDLDASFCPPLQDLIKPPLLVVEGRAAQEQFWAQPPVFDVYGLLGLLEGDGDGVEVVLAIDVPLDLVPISFGGEGGKAMALGDAGALLVGELLVLLVMAVIGVDEIAKLANLVLNVNGGDFRVVEVCTCTQRAGISSCASIAGFPAGAGDVEGYL